MASPLARAGVKFLRPLVKNKGALIALPSRAYAYWNKDWKPGPYPKTVEERIAAAKKYGMRPEDYKPFPDDGFGYGDYPDVGKIGTASKDPFEDWDLPEVKRNFGEPLAAEHDLYQEYIYNPQEEYRYSKTTMVGVFLGITGFFIVTYILTLPYPLIQPVKPKQYPGDGQKHYTFEPVD